MQANQTSAAPRGAVLFVVQTSASMARPVAACGGEPALRLALTLVETALDALIERARQGKMEAERWDIAVIASPAVVPGARLFRSLLPGGDRLFVPLADLVASGRPALVATAEGPAPSVLADAGAIAVAWLSRQSAAYPPLLVCCLDGEGTGSEVVRLGRSLQHLATPAGKVALAICGFGPEVQGAVRFPCPTKQPLPAPWAQLRDIAFPLSIAREPHRALALNDLDPGRLVRLARSLVVTPAPAWRLGGGEAPGCEARILWAPKEGNSDEEWEDAQAVAPERGLAVIADGAAQGIFASRWSALLTRSWVDAGPDLASPGALAAWVSSCRRAWREAIGYDDLHGLQQDKVDEIGSAATLLALALERAELPGMPAGVLVHRWRSAAVGDCCLFWVREGKLRCTFPAFRSADFGIAPDLVPTVAHFAPQVRVVLAEGLGKTGDLYGLATDAVAQCLLRSYESGAPVDWASLWAMSNQDWRRQLRTWRAGGQLVNDDATLILLRVTE